MKFIHDGIEFDLCKPEMDGWEFKEYRRIKCDEKYFDLGSIGTWVGERPSHDPHWIATRKPVKPIVEGWEFLEDIPRCPKEDERYYSDIGHRVLLADYNFICGKFWIATKVEPKARKVVRWEITPNAAGSLIYMRKGIRYLSYAKDDSNFIGFEFDDGSIGTSPILYHVPANYEFVFSPSIENIESGRVEVHHAKYALFFE